MSSFITTPGVFTSLTRPSIPYVGQSIFESDTGKVLFYYGTTLGWLPPWNEDWGEIAYVESTTTYAMTSSATDIPGMSITFQEINNRTYSPVGLFQIQHVSGAGSVSVHLTDSLNNILNFKSKGGGSLTMDIRDCDRLELAPYNATGTSKQFKLRANNNANVGNVVASATTKIRLSIFDRGPAGNPVITS